MDLNHRPLPYQGSALTRLSYRPTINLGKATLHFGFGKTFDFRVDFMMLVINLGDKSSFVIFLNQIYEKQYIFMSLILVLLHDFTV